MPLEHGFPDDVAIDDVAIFIFICASDCFRRGSSTKKLAKYPKIDMWVSG